MQLASLLRHAVSGRLGCLWKLLLVLAVLCLIAIGATIAFAPWALHIGGTATPLLHWDGYGEGVTPAGTRVVVALSFGPQALYQRRTSCRGGCGHLGGSGDLCTAHASVHFKALEGKLEAYWRTEGAPMTVRLYRATGDAKNFAVYLQGRWHGNTYAATDESNLWEHFTASGGYQARATTRTGPQVTVLTLHAGGHDAFRAACRRLVAEAR